MFVTELCFGENLKSDIHCCYQLADVKRSSSLPPILKEFLCTYEYFCYSSSLLIQWAASKFKDATFVTYEQVHPDDGFGIVMQKHFESISSPLLSLTKFPDLPSQERRYVSRVGVNFSKLSARDVLPHVSI
jgi:hypothetical protein